MKGWAALTAPSLADLDALARAAFAGLPGGFRARCPGLVIAVEDFPDDETLAELGVDDPFDLTGLYDGIEQTERLLGANAAPPDRVTLYRRPILDEWADRGNVTLEELVRHVLVHEIAHHMGLDDDEIAAIDDWTQ